MQKAIVAVSERIARCVYAVRQVREERENPLWRILVAMDNSTGVAVLGEKRSRSGIQVGRPVQAKDECQRDDQSPKEGGARTRFPCLHFLIMVKTSSGVNTMACPLMSGCMVEKKRFTLRLISVDFEALDRPASGQGMSDGSGANN